MIKQVSRKLRTVFAQNNIIEVYDFYDPWCKSRTSYPYSKKHERPFLVIKKSRGRRVSHRAEISISQYDYYNRFKIILKIFGLRSGLSRGVEILNFVPKHGSVRIMANTTRAFNDARKFFDSSKLPEKRRRKKEIEDTEDLVLFLIGE